jgi:hypothetical protein
MVEPFALQIYRRFLQGESVERLALALGISTERIAQRIRAARIYYDRKRRRAA